MKVPDDVQDLDVADLVEDIKGHGLLTDDNGALRAENLRLTEENNQLKVGHCDAILSKKLF